MKGQRNGRVRDYSAYNDERRRKRAEARLARIAAKTAPAQAPAQPAVETSALDPSRVAAILEMPAADAAPAASKAPMPSELLAMDPAPQELRKPAEEAPTAADVGVADDAGKERSTPPAPSVAPSAAPAVAAAGVVLAGSGTCYRHTNSEIPCGVPDCPKHSWTPPTEQEALLSGRTFLSAAARFMKRVPAAISDAEAIPAGYAFCEVLDLMGLRGRKSSLFMNGSGATLGYLARCEPRAAVEMKGVEAAPRAQPREEAPAPREEAPAKEETVVQEPGPGRRRVVEFR